MGKKQLKNTEWIILIVSVTLAIIGLVALFSATQNTELAEFKKQVQWLLISIISSFHILFISFLPLNCILFIKNAKNNIVIIFPNSEGWNENDCPNLNQLLAPLMGSVKSTPTSNTINIIYAKVENLTITL